MKKIILFVLLFAFNLVVYADEIVLTKNGEPITFTNQKPFMDSTGRFQVPLRVISESLGADVKWNQKTREVTIKLDNKTVILTIGSKSYSINGTKKSMDTQPQVKDGNTVVPLRFVSEALGMRVVYSKNNIRIYDDNISALARKTIDSITKPKNAVKILPGLDYIVNNSMKLIYTANDCYKLVMKEKEVYTTVEDVYFIPGQGVNVYCADSHNKPVVVNIRFWEDHIAIAN